MSLSLTNNVFIVIDIEDTKYPEKKMYLVDKDQITRNELVRLRGIHRDRVYNNKWAWDTVANKMYSFRVSDEPPRSNYSEVICVRYEL